MEDPLNLLGDGGDPTGIGNDMSSQAYNNIQSQEGNLIQWQLELDNILERIEHLLKGDILELNQETGIVDYKTPEDKRLIVLNEYGVQLIMNIISFYLNRNTILSNYKEQRIYDILFDLGNELADLVYINYERMGLNTVEKRSRSSVLIMNILHMIESAYNRALHGEEKNSLRSARVVTQTQPIQTMSHSQVAPQKRSFSMNPFRGFRK